MPVIVTPAIALPSDSYIRQAAPTANQSTDAAVRIGIISGKVSDVWHGLFSFDLSSVGKRRELIKSATLNITGGTFSLGMASPILRRCDAFVAAEVTWNEKSSGVSWTTGGGDYYTEVEITVPGGAGAIAVDVTALVVECLKYSSTMSWILISESGSTASGWSIQSAEHGTPSERPSLDVEYYEGGRRRIINVS